MERQQFQRCFMRACYGAVCDKNSAVTTMKVVPNMGIKVGETLYMFEDESPAPDSYPLKFHQWHRVVATHCFTEAFHDFQMLFKRGAEGSLYVHATCHYNLTGIQKRIIADAVHLVRHPSRAGN